MVSTVVTAIATVFIAVFAAGSVAVGYWQWDALKRADETTRESFADVQRPFLTAGLDIQQRMPMYWDFTVVAENSGQTPTRSLEYFSCESNNPGDPEEGFQNPPSPCARWRGLIGPKTKTELAGTYIGLPYKHLEQLADARFQFYISGVMHYHDLFVGSLEHITKFCFAVIPIRENNVLRPISQPCLYWNCADDDCKADRAAYDSALKAANPQLR